MRTKKKELPVLFNNNENNNHLEHLSFNYSLYIGDLGAE